MSEQRRKPGRPKGPRRDPQERRDELLAAAERAIHDHGPLLSMEAIADEAGVSKATLYDNFDGKRSMAEALVDRWGTRLLSRISVGLDQDLTPHDVLRGGISVLVAVIEREIDLYRFMLSENSNRTLLDESVGPVTTLIDTMLRQAGADPSGAEAMARGLLGGIFAATEWWAEERPMSRHEFVDHLDQLFWPGLAPFFFFGAPPWFPPHGTERDGTGFSGSPRSWSTLRAALQRPGNDDHGGAMSNDSRTVMAPFPVVPPVGVEAGSLRVLVVAPHRPDRHLVERSLLAAATDDLRVLSAHAADLAAALHSIEQHWPDCVVVANDTESITALRTRVQGLVIVSVGPSGDQAELDALGAGADEHLALAELEPDHLLHRCRRAQTRANARGADHGLPREPLQFQAELLSAVGEAVAATDMDGRVVYLNPAAERLYGWLLDEVRGLDGGAVSVSPRSGDGASMLRQQLVSGQPWSGDLWLRRRDGSEFFGRVTNTPMFDPAGTPIGLIGVTTDLTEQLQLQLEAEADRDRLAAAQRCAHLGSFEVDLAAGTITFSDELYRILGLPLGSPVDETTYRRRVHPDDLHQLEEAAARALAGEPEVVDVHRIVRPDGEVRWVEAREATPARSTGRFCGTVLDITERHRVEQQIDHEMRHDSLTGLPNRAEITRRLDLLLQAHRDGGPPVTMAFLDLDRFKVINDGLGHATGDQVLLEVAHRLLAAVGDDGHVGRFGGDEFVILRTGDTTPERSTEEMWSVVACLEEPIEVDHRRFFITASVGVAIGAAGDDSDLLLQATDTAMYESKRATGHRVTYFDDGLRARARRNQRIESDLRHAIELHQLDVHYQPIMQLADGECVGFESLLRWDHPQLGRIGPNDFIPIAEETGLIVPLGEWVLRRSLAQLRQWQMLPGRESLWVAVNLSCNQLNRVGIDDTVTSALAESGVDPASLHLEITESVLMERIDGSLDTLNALRRLGVRLSVDDFGTGYSSLSYLKRLPVQTLKIDRSFTDGIGTEPHDTSIVRAISALADELGLEVLAEGVETEEQLRALQELGCRLGQGYWWSKPMAASSATLWLATRASRRG